MVWILDAFDITGLPKQLFRQRGLLRQCVMREIGIRYRGSALGFSWSFIQPLATLLIYTFVFGWLMGARWGIVGDDWNLGVEKSRTAFSIIMLCGMMVYNLFAESVVRSCSVIVENPNFVKKVVFPLEILVASRVFACFIIGFAWMAILLVGELFFFGVVGWTMLWAPVVLIPLLLLSLGCSFVFASLGVYVRDMQQFIGILVQFLFWAVPVVYPLKMLYDKIDGTDSVFAVVLGGLIKNNPLTVVIEQMRRVFVFGLNPEWMDFLLLTLFGTCVFQCGYWFFVRTRKGFSDVL